MARKNYPDEFKRDAVALYRDTEGATITVIAAELGVSEATLFSVVQGRRCADPAPEARITSVPTAGVETAEQELARLRAQVKDLQAEKTKLATEARHFAVGGQIFRGETNWASRFQFVADHRDAFEVKWLCAVMEIARSSFYAWCAAAQGRTARAAADEAFGRADPRRA